MSKLYIMWDESQIWGVLAVRAAHAMRLPVRLVRAEDIAGGLLRRDRPALLLVPGGSARHKAALLGPGGLAAIRDYVASGGQYLGFCGGAGLALSPGNNAPGIGLCPWQRAHFNDRLQHFMSGHLHMVLDRTADGRNLVPAGLPAFPRLPVWWAGRFAPEKRPEVTILASYQKPAEDFWLADLPIAVLPPDTFAAWRDMYGLSLTPTFLEGQPCVIRAEYGSGACILSYSHLETPDSPDANHWLAHLLRNAASLAPALDHLPPWRIEDQEPAFADPCLDSMDAALRRILRTGLDHGLLFERTAWLVGWRTGIPGASLNNLRAALSAVRGSEPGNRALAFWKTRRARLAQTADLFAAGCVQYLLAERLAQTLSKTLPDMLPQGLLKNQRDALFGPPMQPGGLYRELMDPLDHLAFLQLSGA